MLRNLSFIATASFLLRTGLHFNISINISTDINISIRKICANQGDLSIGIDISTRKWNFFTFSYVHASA